MVDTKTNIFSFTADSLTLKLKYGIEQGYAFMCNFVCRFHLEVDPSRPAKHELMVVMKTEDGMFIKATPRTRTDQQE